MEFNHKNVIDKVEEIVCEQNTQKISDLIINLKSIFNDNIHTTEKVMEELIDVSFLEEIKQTVKTLHIPVYFGKTLRDIKIVIIDNSLRDHEIFIKYADPNRLVISSVNLPHSIIQDIEYDSLRDIIISFRNHIEFLGNYFNELEKIDQFCTIKEPLKPSFKDDYRRILLDDRIWLHVEVSPEGLGTNIHLVGQSDLWSDKLQNGLLSWDHDKDIVNNIMSVFDLIHFPTGARSESSVTPSAEDKYVLTVNLTQINTCSICLCVNLQDSGVPLPLCQNTICGVYFHRSCLYQWLVACSGGRPPAFGVATGNCPTCLQHITCNDKDD